MVCLHSVESITLSNLSSSFLLAAENEINFTEFLETIAAMAVYKVCNPYIPLGRRVEVFLHQVLASVLALICSYIVWRCYTFHPIAVFVPQWLLPSANQAKKKARKGPSKKVKK